jgi:MFS family permease
MNIRQDGITPNAARLLWAGFAAILATGVGFGVRGGILANWGAEFGFTGAELGAIAGAGLMGFCFGVIIGGLVVDKLGYGRLIVAAFVFHALSAFVTFAAMPGQEKAVAYNFLYWGAFISLPYKDVAHRAPNQRRAIHGSGVYRQLAGIRAGLCSVKCDQGAFVPVCREV